MMEKLDIQVMQKDGSVKDYEVQNERGTNIYQVLDKDRQLAVFEALADGEWKLSSNPGNIDDDQQHRIINQLNGFVR